MSDDIAFFEDPKTRAAYDEINKYVGKDDAKWQAIIKEIIPYCYSQAIGVYMPQANGYRLWWPWFKNYHGEYSIGYDNQMAFVLYAWIDQDMKTAMGY
jgi:peptide/nickel transport system substrate-binding protein